ncbi:hypothetical protein IFM89_038338 [Coptis chinensis]|uniref:NAC domain-containing protein n=1 Tax=Coptis chinensis TaxID=261450 RepID=A0A835I5U9_9MAGN|nr:hypothetical protein IFM89_038338 [Coptis chinensis]
MSRHSFSPSVMMEISALFPGFRFSPTDEELVCHYLKRKINGLEMNGDVIPEVEICKFEPWDLPAKSMIQSEHEWFFFSPNDRKYPNGSQARRATEVGFWKATGKERNIKSRKNVIGTKRTLVFHLGRAPRGARTDWIMHEYCMKDTKEDKPQDSYVICRLRKKQEFTIKKDDPNSESDDHISPENPAINVATEVCSDLQHSETGMNGNVKPLEDDCFDDILKDEIVQLDESTSQEPQLLPTVAEGSVVFRSTQPAYSLTSRVNHFQGTAHRRIGLERYRIKRNHKERQEVDDIEYMKEVKEGDAKQLTKDSKTESSVHMFNGWLICSIFIFMVVLLPFLQLVLGGDC